MTATLLSPNVDMLLKDKVVIMEDDPDLQQKIKDVMKNKFNWDVIVANSLDEVTHIADNNEAAYYIFDVHMGENRDQEGLDALEVVKNINNKAFVAILTAFASRHSKRASNLGADFFQEKSIYLDNDINRIANEMLLHKIKIENETTENIEQLRNIYEKLYELSHPNGVKDKNITAYEQLKSNSKWLKKHQGEYVAFVDGELKFSHKNKHELLQFIREKYPNKERFYVAIKNPEVVDEPIDEPISLSFDFL